MIINCNLFPASFVHNNFDVANRRNNISLFAAELTRFQNWNVPHAVHDEMLRRAQEDKDIGVLVGLMKEHLVSFGRPKPANQIRKKSIDKIIEKELRDDEKKELGKRADNLALRLAKAAHP